MYKLNKGYYCTDYVNFVKYFMQKSLKTRFVVGVFYALLTTGKARLFTSCAWSFIQIALHCKVSLQNESRRDESLRTPARMFYL
jgi:hypothetical protein